VFLQVIKVNSLKVAVFLLGGAFVYDIFFVFVSPFFFKESVMITVATSGGPPTADPAWCERYPTDKGCLGGQPLPMLFTIPRMFDYQGGSSLLGLGDIVIPGLLLSFAARFDAAKSLLVILGGGNGRLQAVPCPEKGGCGRCRLCASGYYPLVAFSYAVGLFMANAAVYLMRMGQPALLYIVPCTLATMIFLGWRRRELDDLWEGPVAIRTADDILFGQQAPDNSGRQPIVQDDEAREIDLVEDNTRLLA
jgi:signal peptide peptidase-like protein 2B